MLMESGELTQRTFSLSSGIDFHRSIAFSDIPSHYGRVFEGGGNTSEEEIVWFIIWLSEDSTKGLF